MGNPLNGFKFLFGIALCGFFLLACENDINEVRALTQKSTAVEQGKDIVTYYSQMGKMRAKLTAPIMKRFEVDTPYIEFPKSLHVDFYNDSLKIESILKAKYGKYRENENKVFLKDSVVIINTTGDTIYCQELWWDQRKEKFYTDKFAEIHQKNANVLYAHKGLEASQDLSSKTFFQANGTAMVANDSIP